MPKPNNLLKKPVSNRSPFLLSVIGLLILGLLPLNLWAEENPIPVTPPPQPSNARDETPVDITADYLEHLVKDKQVNAKGNVQVIYEDRTATADEMKVNTETGQGEAFGNVIMENEQGTHIEAEEG